MVHWEFAWCEGSQGGKPRGAGDLRWRIPWLANRWTCRYCLVLNCLLHTWHVSSCWGEAWTLARCCLRLLLLLYAFPHSGHTGLLSVVLWWSQLRFQFPVGEESTANLVGPGPGPGTPSSISHDALILQYRLGSILRCKILLFILFFSI